MVSFLCFMSFVIVFVKHLHLATSKLSNKIYCANRPFYWALVCSIIEICLALLAVPTLTKPRWAPIFVSAWMWGLSGTPDAPHTASLKLVSPHSQSAEGRGVGKQEKLSVGQESDVIVEQDLLKAAERYGSVKISFELRLTELTTARWETLLLKKSLYIQVPKCLISEGSKEGFIALLEFAEEVLRCSDIIVYMEKDREDRAQLIRTFMFLGFSVLNPGHELIPINCDHINLYMRYDTE